MSETKKMDMLLNYLTKLARAMMANGATVEHTSIAIEKNAEAYHLAGLSTLVMNNYVSVSFHDENDHTYMKQLNIPSAEINLEKLKLLNDLSYKVCANPPKPEELGNMLRSTKASRDYPPIVIVLCQMLAICSICGILGGSLRDMLTTGILTFILFWLFRFMNTLRTDEIVNNALGMFIATFLGYILVDIGIGEHIYYVLVSTSLLMIPGIQLVNAFRNLICGNELNGMVQLLHVFLESASLAAGTWMGVALFGGIQTW